MRNCSPYVPSSYPAHPILTLCTLFLPCVSRSHPLSFCAPCFHFADPVLTLRIAFSPSLILRTSLSPDAPCSHIAVSHPSHLPLSPRASLSPNAQLMQEQLWVSWRSRICAKPAEWKPTISSCVGLWLCRFRTYLPAWTYAAYPHVLR
jgi:hypothetical protein